MAFEIEHKYLVTGDSYLELCDSRQTRGIRQGYLSRDPERTVRVRTVLTGGKQLGFITVKGKNRGDTRLEFEYPVPYAQAEQMLSLCAGSIVEKTRYLVPFQGYTWEVDIFQGARQGLRVAEIELPESRHDYPLPPFAGKEVTGDPAYYNSNL